MMSKMNDRNSLLLISLQQFKTKDNGLEFKFHFKLKGLSIYVTFMKMININRFLRRSFFKIANQRNTTEKIYSTSD